MKLNRPGSIKKVYREKALIQYESDEDEGAAEFEGELNSVLEVLEDSTKTDQECIDAANYVGVKLEFNL